jgi:inner membrane protein
VDNVTHTMVGAALGQAGLRRVTGLGTATLMIAANLPDLDVLVIPFADSLPFRRGWTHGPIGLVVLPLLLAAAVVGWDRAQARRGRRPRDRPPVQPRAVLGLAYLGAFTHPFFDWLNTYGIRLLMPFSQEWFYGDAVFIIDPWIWLALGLALWLGRRRRKAGRPLPERPAAVALVLVALYVGGMVGGSRAASGVATREIEARGLGPVERLMAGPVPANPFQREILYDRGPSYGTGVLSLPGMSLSLDPEPIPTNATHPLAVRAAQDPAFQGFLYWSRFPFFSFAEEGDSVRVHVADLRFGRGPGRGWATRSLLLPPEGPLAGGLRQ